MGVLTASWGYLGQSWGRLGGHLGHMWGLLVATRGLENCILVGEVCKHFEIDEVKLRAL